MSGEREKIVLGSKKTTQILTVLSIFFALALVHTAFANTGPIIETYHYVDPGDYCGAQTDIFTPDENVCVQGSGYVPSTEYYIYVVDDKATWSDGDTIPLPVTPVTTVSSDGSGAIPCTVVWYAPLDLGKYDIVVDDGNGIYDVGTDGLDDNDIQVSTPGFLVIPEVLLGTILALAGFFAALGAFRLHKKRQSSAILRQ